MDNLSRDLDRARGKRNALAFKRDALASDVTTLTAQIAELEARLSEEKDRRERERIGGEIEGIKKRLAYSFFQRGYIATKRREKKEQRRIGSARQLDLTVKRRDPNAPIRVALDDFRRPRTRICRIGVFDALILCGRAAAVTPPVSPASVQGPFSPPWPPQPYSQKRPVSALLEQLYLHNKSPTATA
ncbi:MAG: hypothetical protein WCD83_16810 [Pseudolabrys sp.]